MDEDSGMIEYIVAGLVGGVIGAALMSFSMAHRDGLYRSSLRLANSRIRYAESRYWYIMDSLRDAIGGERMTINPNLLEFRDRVSFSYQHAKNFFSDRLEEVR